LLILALIHLMDYWTSLQFVTFRYRDGLFGTTETESETAVFYPEMC